MQTTPATPPQTEGLRFRAGRLIATLAEIDFTKPVSFLILGVVYLASRAYWLDLGYGTDPDAWRVALVADYLWEEGEYFPSRLPGYPLHEFATAAVIKGGWIATNASVLLVSLAGVYVFAWLARRLELANAGLLTLGFAFAPLLWINSVMTMDYMWALTFLLASYLAVTYKRPGVAGVLLGIAAGFRLTSLFMIPVFWLLFFRTDRRDEIRPLTLSAAATALVVFLPVILTYGINLLNFYDEAVHIEDFIRRLGKDGLGVVGAIAVLMAVLVSLLRLRTLPGDLLREPQVLVWVAAIVVLFASYTRLPHEIAYLVPVFPFAFFLMSRYFSRTVLTVVLATIVVSGFVDVTSLDNDAGLTRETFTGARIGKGMLLSDIETRGNQMDFAREVRQMTSARGDIRRPAVVAVGFIYPALAKLHHDELEIGLLDRDKTSISQLSDKGRACDPACEDVPDIEYVWLLEYERVERYLDEGRTIYYTADAARSTLAVYGYRLAYFGGLELPLSRENPSLGEGAATTDR